jgi:hypothetical protein
MCLQHEWVVTAGNPRRLRVRPIQHPQPGVFDVADGTFWVRKRGNVKELRGGPSGVIRILAQIREIGRSVQSHGMEWTRLPVEIVGTVRSDCAKLGPKELHRLF